MTVAFRGVSGRISSTSDLVLPRPSATVVGDLLLAVIQSAAAVTHSPPAGWALVRSDTPASGNKVEVYSRISSASGAVPAETFTRTAAASTAVGFTVAYSGTAPVVTASAVQLSQDGTNAVVAPSLVGTIDSVLVAIWSTSTETGINHPAGMTERYDANVADNFGLSLADQTLAAGGATGTRTGSLQSGTGSAKIGQSLLLAEGSLSPYTPAIML